MRKKNFFREADTRKNELLSRWGQVDRLQQVAETIGTDADTLYAWITSESQIAFFRRYASGDADA